MSSASAPTMVNFDAMQLVPPPAAMEEFVYGLIQADSGTTDEKRLRQRHHMAAAIPAVALDENFQPMGEPFMVMTRNISTTGISLVSTSAVDAKRMAIQMTGAQGEKIQVALEVLRCRQLSDFFELGGRYLCKLVPAPA